MKKILIVLALVSLCSCKKDNETTVNKVVNEVKESTKVLANEGFGKVVLACNGKELIAQGRCGALTSMGELTIAVTDETNQAKVFTITFNGEDFPKNGTIYKIKSKDYTTESTAPNDDVSVSFSEGLPNNKMNTWGSENASGTVQFVYHGNEVKCTLKDIVLTGSEVFNANDLRANGTVSGELTFYKN